MAAVVISWLQEMKWEVYQEVQIHRYSSVCDIVAIQNGLSWFIECKTSLGIAVMEQAYRWKYMANYTSVATSVIPSHFCETILRNSGIGALTCSKHKEINEWVRPKLNRKADKTIFSLLTEDHKTFAKSGNSNGQHWSPFKKTCQDILLAVKENPGINLKQLIDEVDTHYASTSTARSCIAKWGEKGSIPGVILRREGRNVKFYPSETATF